MDLTEPGVGTTAECRFPFLILCITDGLALSNTDAPISELVKKFVNICPTAYDAAANADVIVILTEWDEFKSLDYEKIYASMRKPAFIFDGRLLLDAKKLRSIGCVFEPFRLNRHSY